MKQPRLSKEEICRMFGCTTEQLNAQYAANAKVLGKMKRKAIRTGKKVNKYSAGELRKAEAWYNELSKAAL